jgi:methionyl-tRNA formyltransferase
MGTPDFACPALKKLIADPYFKIIAVYSREPQIAGRGNFLAESPVHRLALESGLKIITPKNLRDPEIQREFLDLKPDAAVVVAYGLILPPKILNGTRFGCINIHPSLLPKWRGAAPIQRTIMAGDMQTGISIIKMNENVDSGEIIFQEKFSLKGCETYKELAEKFSKMGAGIIAEALKNLQDANLSLDVQNNSLATYAKKITKAECEIDWQSSAQEIERKIRALNGSLEAYFNYKSEKIKVFAAEISDKNFPQKKPGEIIDQKLLIQCQKGSIRPLILQRQGKKVMPLEEFLRGFKNLQNLSHAKSHI